MKKLTAVLITILLSFTVYAQKNLSVDVSDKIYDLLDYYQIKGWCSYLGTAKPYTASRIIDAVDEILLHKENMRDSEVQALEEFKAKYTEKSDKKNGSGHVSISNGSEKFPVSFNYDFSLDTSASTGFYTDSSWNKGGFDFITRFDFNGDVTKWISYDMEAFFDFTTMPLYESGNDYFVGYYWYDDGVSEYDDGDYYTVLEDGTKQKLREDDTGYYYKDSDGNRIDVSSVLQYAEPKRRTIKKFLNNSYLPYSYHKPWSGQIYFLTNFSASGLEGWATEPGISGGVTAEVRSSLFDNHVSIGAGRYHKEWAGMDNGSSLVLNANAQPFFEFDTSWELFSWLHFSNLVGILEYPNQDYINNGAYSDVYTNKDEATVFQNAFSINMIDLDWKYVHLDMGTNVVWPKRFEIGYMFPLVLYVEYQNHIGDYDNMAIFGDIKFRLPGVGSIWGSLYMDEINVTSNLFKQARVMYAGQLGSKFVLPFLPQATLSMRYTKIEPFCYTHNSVNYTPWYDHYISVAYVNNGEGLGYYLDPNSDEFFLRLETKPTSHTNVALQYQFIRHGADYGSQQVPGSSYYSEMTPDNRDDLEKYFLHDGAYNWMHIVDLEGTITHKTARKNMVEFSANVGFLYSYWTMIDDDKYDRSVYGNNGNCADVDENTPFHFVDTDEYPEEFGVVLGTSFTIKY